MGQDDGRGEEKQGGEEMKLCIDGSREHCHCEDIEDSVGDMVVVCHDCQQTLGKKCEIFARPCGYLSPVQNWNKGKRSEFELRKKYAI